MQQSVPRGHSDFSIFPTTSTNAKKFQRPQGHFLYEAIEVSREIGGRTLTLGTGSYAKLAAGAVTVHYGETVVFGAVARAKPREGIDFFPLQVDYRDRRAAAGKF